MTNVFSPTLISVAIVCVTLSGCGPNGEALKKLDPANNANWKSKRITETSGDTSYIFEGDAKPPLTLKNDGNATLASTADVNAALESLNLPTVSETRPDKGYVENERVWRGQYHWIDYPLGPLVVERTLATDKRNYDNYDAIWKIRIEKQQD